MELIIKNSRKLSDMQRDFNEAFPYLKIEFFSKPHDTKKASLGKDRINSDRTVKSIRTKSVEGKINLTESRTVAEFEGELQSIYGLNVQVFRKSGNVWIETSLTDEWTLGIQNKEGFELSKPLNTKKYPEEASGLEQE